MPTIQEVRQKYPQYNDMSDTDLADKLHSKFYADMDKNEFYSKIGLANHDKQSPSLLQRIGQDAANRQKTVQDTAQHSALLGGSKAVGQAAGFISQDIPGEIIKSGFNALPEAAQEGIKDVGNYAINTKLGKLGISALKSGGEVWEHFKEVHPDWASFMGDVANAGSFLTALPPAAIATEAAAPVVKAGAEIAGEGLKKAVVVPSKAIASGAKTLKTGVGARAAEDLDGVSSAMRAESSETFKKAFDVGVALDPKKHANIAMKIDNSVGRISERRHGDTFSVLSDLKERMKDGPIGLEELYDFRQDLNDVISDNTDSLTGRMKSDAFKASKALDSLDDVIYNLDKYVPPELAQKGMEASAALDSAKSQWSKARKFETVAALVRQGDGDQAKIKAAFSRFVKKPKNKRGFSDEEWKYIVDASRNTKGESVMKALGRFGLSPSNVYLPLVGGSLGAMSGAGPAAGALVGAGTAARQANQFIARGKAEKALQAIEGRK